MRPRLIDSTAASRRAKLAAAGSVAGKEAEPRDDDLRVGPGQRRRLGAAHGDLEFGAGLTDETLWFSSSGSNLVIDVLGTTEHVTLSGWFGTNKRARVKEIEAGGLKLDTGVSRLVIAMASFAAHNPGFSPTAAGTTMPTNAAVQSAIAANWHH